MAYAIFGLIVVILVILQEFWMRKKIKSFIQDNKEAFSWRGQYFVLPLIAVTLIAGAYVLREREQAVRENFQKSVAGLAPILAYELTQDKHYLLASNTPSDDQRYSLLISHMVEWMKYNPEIQSIYTLRKLPDSRIVFILCPETDYDHNGIIEGAREQRMPVGTPFTEAIAEVEEAFKGKPAFEHTPTVDFWGVAITYYQPVYDQAGKLEAVLGIDIDGQQWYGLVRKEQYSIIMVVMGIILAISAFYQYLFSKKIKDIYTRQQQNELVESELRFRSMAENSPVMMWLVDCDEKYRYLNKTWREFTGHSSENMTEPQWRELVHPEDYEGYKQRLEEAFINKSAFKLEFRIRSASGEYYWISCIGVPRWQGGIFKGFSGAALDITERRLAEEQLKYISLHDPLTGLLNRVYFEQEMQWLQENWQEAIGIMVCDVDGLKLVNDILGHATGDQLLIKAAVLLTEVFQSEGTIVRIGGDEIAVLLPGTSKEKLHQYYQSLNDKIEEHNNSNPDFPLSMSAGYAYKANAEIALSTIFNIADSNMYQVKKKNSRKKHDAILRVLFKSTDEQEMAVFSKGDLLEEMVVAVARQVGFEEERINNLKILIRFHDIGEVGITHRILFKAEPLTPEEILEMRRHAEIGFRIARAIPQLEPMAEYILKHHERWDGKGYPLGLENHEIPIECRMLAIADAYAAMTADRPYRKAMSHLTAVAEIERNSGKQFDPELVAIFVKLFGGRQTT